MFNQGFQSVSCWCRFTGFQRIKAFALVVLCLLSQACTTIATPGNPAVPAHTFVFSDGGEAIFYTLDKAPWSAAPQPAPPAPRNVLFVVAGSGCQSMGRFLPGYFTGLEGESGATRIFILHKRFISPASEADHCSDAFVRADHLSQWQSDQHEFIVQQLAQLTQQGVHPLRIALLGISEGAELVPLLAREIPAVTHIALLSHSGMAAFDVYAALAARYPHMQKGWLQLQQALANRPADQDAMRIHGRSWRYWAELRDLHPQANLLATCLPVLIAVGDADSLIPPNAPDRLQADLFAAGKHDVSVLHFPDADHGLRADGRHYLPDFMHQMDLWLEREKQEISCIKM
ncbi:MAG: alpha/beta hydrolase [Burkholderiales bacterium]|nr:alpha/beta hydrolase [Burkholderiales bacterium]